MTGFDKTSTHNIRLCKLKNKLSLIYFLGLKQYTEGNKATLKEIVLDNPTKDISLPPPLLGQTSNYVTVECIGETLIAIGHSNGHSLMMQKYNFDD